MLCRWDVLFLLFDVSGFISFVLNAGRLCAMSAYLRLFRDCFLFLSLAGCARPCDVSNPMSNGTWRNCCKGDGAGPVLVLVAMPAELKVNCPDARRLVAE